MTPDGREVDFRCHHNHRTQSAAISCASTVRKQIERGQSLNLVTRVRSTPASREAARQRALQKEADRRVKAAQRAQAAQQRAEQQQIHRQAKVAERAEAAQRRQSAAQQRAQQKEVRQTQAALQRMERRDQAAHQRAERWNEIHLRNDERWDRVHRRGDERTHQRRRYGWPAYGLLIAAGVILLAFVLVGAGGSNSNSAPAVAGGALISIGVILLLVCAVAALWRRLRRDRRKQTAYPATDGRKIAGVSYQVAPTSMGYDSGGYPAHIEDGYPTHSTPPAHSGDVLPPGTPKNLRH